jgi:hypothetical protein
MVKPLDKKLISLLAIGVFLFVGLAFGVPGAFIAVRYVHEADGTKRKRDDRLALIVCAAASAVAFVGAIQWARVATGRKKIKWSWDDGEETAADE